MDKRMTSRIINKNENKIVSLNLYGIVTQLYETSCYEILTYGALAHWICCDGTLATNG